MQKPKSYVLFMEMKGIREKIKNNPCSITPDDEKALYDISLGVPLEKRTGAIPRSKKSVHINPTIGREDVLLLASIYKSRIRELIGHLKATCGHMEHEYYVDLLRNELKTLSSVMQIEKMIKRKLQEQQGDKILSIQVLFV